MQLLSTSVKNNVLASVKDNLAVRRNEIISANRADLDAWEGDDQAMYDRLIVNDKKVDGMIESVQTIIADDDPVGKARYHFTHPNGLQVTNKTAPFGTVLIIYESRPDVTIEAAIVAFKSNNRILLKGGKEAIQTNKVLVDCWKDALKIHGLESDWITLLEMNRQETQAFLKNPDRPLDLIVPRGGDGLIRFVKDHASCPVLVSGRGNNFIYVHKDADWEMALNLIFNAKTDKISACNALDKVVVHSDLIDIDQKVAALCTRLNEAEVEILLDTNFDSEYVQGYQQMDLSSEWDVEYLALKIAIGKVSGMAHAIEMINRHSGGHSVGIITESRTVADQFMNEVDAAAVYHNASTRFTDGGQFGMGAELAISTDKLHHRGPLGLHELVTNKWYVFGNGQVR